MKKEKFTSLFIALALGVTGRNGGKSDPKITFTENKGQVCDQNYKLRPDVLFTGQNMGSTFHLKANGISYQLNKVDSWNEGLHGKEQKMIKTPKQISIYRVDINWVGSNTVPSIIRNEELEEYTNYYLPQCPNGVLNVRTYKNIEYRNVYKGIDLKWYTGENGLEYDFIVAPGSDPGQIKLEIKGAKLLSVNNKGELEIETPFGTIKEKAPYVYQGNKSNRIKCNWNLKGTRVGFSIANYNRKFPLVIDPVVRVWGTYYGGSSSDYIESCSTSSTGDLYVSGYSGTGGGTVIATVGSHQATFGGQTDGFLAKFNSAGVRQWATYYGGAQSDDVFNSTFDNTNGRIYICGHTNSTAGISSVGSHQSVSGGSFDAFLAGFNTSGVRQWATFYGGPGVENAKGCSTDAAGNVFLTGGTTSTAGISTAGAHQAVSGGGQDAYIVKFNSAGVRQWATYYGGPTGETAFSCSSNSSGEVYMVGAAFTTSTPSVLTTAGAHQTTSGGNDDGFLVKFDANGVRLWGTLYGGSAADYISVCQSDNSGFVYISGNAQSTNSIATAATHQNILGGSYDGFVAKFNSGGVRQWGTYYGGTAMDIVRGIATNTLGEVFIAGNTLSQNTATFVMATSGSYQNDLASAASDAFLAKFNLNGTLQWGTYYGGVGAENGYGCAVIGSTIYLCGSTSGSLSTTPGCHQSVYGGGSTNGFIASFNDCAGGSFSITGSTDICLGQGSTLTAVGSSITTYTWSTSSNTSSVSITPTSTMNYSVVVGTATAVCSYSASTTVSVTTPPAITVSASSTLICSGDPLTLMANGATTYSWSTGSNAISIVVTPTASITYTVNGASGPCNNSITVNINVNPTPTISIVSSSSLICSGEPVVITANGANTYTWDTGDNTAAITVTPSITTVYTVTGYDALGCSTTNIFTQPVSACIGMNEIGLGNNEIKIYPNPSSDKICIETVFNNFKMTLYDALGKLVYENKINSNKATLNSVDFAKGVYTLKLYSDGIIIVKKIILE